MALSEARRDREFWASSARCVSSAHATDRNLPRPSPLFYARGPLPNGRFDEPVLRSRCSIFQMKIAGREPALQDLPRRGADHATKRAREFAWMVADLGAGFGRQRFTRRCASRSSSPRWGTSMQRLKTGCAKPIRRTPDRSGRVIAHHEHRCSTGDCHAEDHRLTQIAIPSCSSENAR